MLIDNRGRLFGKISIADIVIVGVVLALILFGLKYFSNNNDGSAPSIGTDKIRITFSADDIPADFTDALYEGAPVRVQKSELSFGKVTDVAINDSMYYGVSSEGKWVASAKPNYKMAAFTVEGTGTYAGDRALLEGVELYRGKYIGLVSGMTIFWAKVTDIEK